MITTYFRPVLSHCVRVSDLLPASEVDDCLFGVQGRPIGLVFHIYGQFEADDNNYRYSFIADCLIINIEQRHVAKTGTENDALRNKYVTIILR